VAFCARAALVNFLAADMTHLPLADRYARFRDSVFSGVAEALPGFAEPMTEMELQSLWFSGAFGSEFTSTDGKAVRIADFGVWNSGAGPDFNGCAVVIDGQTLRGDIELDPDARDWERHTHGANENFNRVVLHLFLHAPEERFFTRTSAHQEVPQVLLRADMLPEGVQPKRHLAPARLGRCATPLREMEAARVQSIIESAAQHRLELKSNRLHRSVAAQGREQAIYQALAQTLGYRKNQQPFAILAQRLPLKRILQLDAAKREAWLFGVSGFLESVRSDDTEPTTRSYLRQLWSEWWKLRDGCARWLDERQLPRWKLNAIRPGNHPQRRLGALAAMLRAWSVIVTPLADGTRWSQMAWRESLLALTHDFWATHYTLLAEAAGKPVALIGETRVQEMLANVAYPLLVPERTRLWAEYLELPALLDNQKVRLAVQRLFGDDPRGKDFTKKLHQQQGLLQIYEDFCLEDDSACANCPFPERLKEWS
jgi:hypothetical protein